MKVKPVILGLKGYSFSEAERALFKEEKPLGIILFRRNIEALEVRDVNTNELRELIQDKAQLTGLIEEIRDNIGLHTLICIDQEGGRVRRLTTPTFAMRPAAKFYGDLIEKEGIESALSKCEKGFFGIGTELKALGMNINFTPVADVFHEGASKVIGDRSFSGDPEVVKSLCQAALTGMDRAGVVGAVKHIPGHGRAPADSHRELPVIDASLEDLERSDFSVFQALAPHCRIAMTAHIVYKALDPANPVTLSKLGINYIREKIGFKGHLVSDAIEMGALAEYPKAKIAELSFAAGVDIILECSGNTKDMSSVMEALPFVPLSSYKDLFTHGLGCELKRVLISLNLIREDDESGLLESGIVSTITSYLFDPSLLIEHSLKTVLPPQKLPREAEDNMEKIYDIIMEFVYDIEDDFLPVPNLEQILTLGEGIGW